MKTIAQQLNIKTLPFTIKDSNGNEIYREWSDGTWSKWVPTLTAKWEYADGNEIYYESSNGYWQKREYADGKEIYFEDSKGLIVDNRPKTDVQKAIDLLTKEGLIVDGKILKTKL